MANSTFLYFATDGTNQVTGYVVAASLTAAETQLAAQYTAGLGVTDGLAGPVSWAIVLASASGVITPTN